MSVVELVGTHRARREGQLAGRKAAEAIRPFAEAAQARLPALPDDEQRIAFCIAWWEELADACGFERRSAREFLADLYGAGKKGGRRECTPDRPVDAAPRKPSEKGVSSNCGGYQAPADLSREDLTEAPNAR